MNLFTIVFLIVFVFCILGHLSWWWALAAFGGHLLGAWAIKTTQKKELDEWTEKFEKKFGKWD